MKILPYLLGTTLAAIAFACTEGDNIGSSIIQDEVKVIVDSAYTISGQSIPNNRVQSRTTTQLLGVIDAKEYGKFSSDFVTQFMAAAKIDTVGVSVNDIDSLQLMLAIPKDGFVGDSIVPMGFTVYELTRALTSPIYSDFDPAGYYDPAKPIATKMYAANSLGVKVDSTLNKAYRYVFAKLPRELGQRLYSAYIQKPNSYLEPGTFSTIFPGLYITNSFGSGRVVKIDGSSLRLFYRQHEKLSNGNDTTYSRMGTYYAVSPEVITNNNISYQIAPQLKQMADEGLTPIVAPLGYDVQFQFPLQEMIDRYRNNPGALTVINTLAISFPVEEIANNYGINPPPHLLMILSSKKDEFFEKYKTTDEISSFYAAYDATNKRYNFTGMRNYILEMLKKQEITPEDYTFTLVPVSVDTENYSYSSSIFISSITPYILNPTMALLNLDKAKITFTYTRQSVIN